MDAEAARTARRANQRAQPPNTKLDWDTVRTIRERYSQHNVPLMKLAEDYGVRVGTISFIVDNITWRDPEYIPPQRTPGRGRTPGESHPHAKLTWEDVREIRRRATEPYATQDRLGEEYGVTAATIGNIIRNQTWVDPHYTPPGQPSPRMTMDRAEEIRKRYRAGEGPMQALADEYGVSPSLVSSIIRNKAWYVPPKR